METRPNLFHFATSELSQDAVLCWMLSWAKPEHQVASAALHELGVGFLGLIFKKAGRTPPPVFSSVEVRRQAGHIDVLCLIDGTTAILIEDKTRSKQHSEQLPRYVAHVSATYGVSVQNIIPVYIQTGGQSDYREVTKYGYVVLERIDLLGLLEDDAGREARKASDILDDFGVHLRHIEDDVQSFLRLPLGKWSGNAWMGFYTCIQAALGDGEWDYVPNAAGGFLGFWWHFVSSNDCEIYLQLEQEKFCFKIVMPDGERRRSLREHWHTLILSKCPARGLRAKRPARFGNGQYMTVAILDQEFRQFGADGRFDINGTVHVLKSAQGVLDDCLTATTG